MYQKAEDTNLRTVYTIDIEDCTIQERMGEQELADITYWDRIPIKSCPPNQPHCELNQIIN